MVHKRCACGQQWLHLDIVWIPEVKWHGTPGQQVVGKKVAWFESEFYRLCDAGGLWQPTTTWYCCCCAWGYRCFEGSGSAQDRDRWTFMEGSVQCIRAPLPQGLPVRPAVGGVLVERVDLHASSAAVPICPDPQRSARVGVQSPRGLSRRIQQTSSPLRRGAELFRPAQMRFRLAYSPVFVACASTRNKKGMTKYYVVSTTNMYYVFFGHVLPHCVRLPRR